MDETFCGKCNKICYGEVLEAHGEFFHQNCFKCKACLRELMTNGFFLFENEFYCTNDYQKLFGIGCVGCGKFIEGESVSILDDTFHEECFICASCRTPFPPGAKVNLNGNDYICENCNQGVDGVLPVDGVPPVQTQEGTCAGCGNDIKTGQALLALERQWHLWCFTCNKCGCLLSGEYMGRDGVPFCEKDYQEEFGVSCAGCGGFITGKVLQAGEKHYHPQCSRCAKCGQMFGEGEEMYLQGSEIWHPQCSDEYQREAEENERLAEQEKQAREEEERKELERQELENQRKEQEERDQREREERERAERERTEREWAERERAERERAERERAERERAEKERAERERAERERAERERADRERAEKERADREREERERAEREREDRAKVEQKFYRRPPPESKSTENLAYAAKPFGAPKTTPSSISINFKPKTTQPAAGRWKPPGQSEPAKTVPSFRPSPYPQESPRLTDPPATTTKTTTEIKTYSVRTEEKRSFSPPTTREEKQPPIQNGFNKASSVSSDEGAPSRPPPPPTRGAASQNWKSRVSSSSYSVKRATSPPSTQEPQNDSAYPRVNVEIDVRSANKPMSFVDSATRRNDPYEPDSKTNIIIKSVPTKTTDDTPVSSAVFRRLPNRDRDQLRENRKSLPAMPDNYNFSEPPRMRENGPSRIEAKAFNRRSLPSLDKYEDVPEGQIASTTYPYHVLKSTNYKMPKEIDRSRLEIYLSDEDFESIFHMQRGDFYKQPAWKQRDLKKRVVLF